MDDVYYVTSEDVHKIFTENMDSLYLLALLLIGDQEKAEQCFVASVADSVRATNAFRQWAHACAKRAIIQNAVRVTHPSLGNANLSAANDFRADKNQPNLADPHFAAVLKLRDFESVCVRHLRSGTLLRSFLRPPSRLLGSGNSQSSHEAFERLTEFLRAARFHEESAT